jgi:hypothetical protein
MSIGVVETDRQVTGSYKVDVSRGQRIGRVSSEWFSRPDDERYLSLADDGPNSQQPNRYPDERPPLEGKAFPCGRACSLGRPLLRGHPATPRE